MTDTTKIQQIQALIDALVDYRGCEEHRGGGGDYEAWAMRKAGELFGSLELIDRADAIEATLAEVAQ